MTRISTTTILIVVGLCLTSSSGCGPDNAPPPAPLGKDYLHVAEDGWTQNDGSPEAPLFQINHALNKAFQEGYRGVKVAAGDYTSSLSRIEIRFYGGVDVIGGCDRQTWEPTSDRYSRMYALEGPIPGLGIRTPTLVSGLEIVGNPATWGSRTSCAVYLDGCSSELRFERCRFLAQSGYDEPDAGRDGSSPTPRRSRRPAARAPAPQRLRCPVVNRVARVAMAGAEALEACPDRPVAMVGTTATWTPRCPAPADHRAKTDRMESMAATVPMATTALRFPAWGGCPKGPSIRRPARRAPAERAVTAAAVAAAVAGPRPAPAMAAVPAAPGAAMGDRPRVASAAATPLR